MSKTAKRSSHRIDPDSARRIAAIDLLKGLAIIGVMAQHAFSSRGLYEAWDTLHVGQAVPVFFVILGLNASASLGRRGTARLGRLFSREYLLGRVDRLLLPFLLLWPIAAGAALLRGRFHVGGLIVAGVYPMQSDPGNYFVTILLEFALLFPLVFWCLRRAPVMTSVLLIALDVGFELAAPHIAVFSSSSTGRFVYDAAIPKYAIAILAGYWLARVRPNRALLAGLTPLAAGSVVYLVALHQHPDGFSWLMPTFSRSTNFMSFFYAIWLTLVGLLFLPHQARSRLSRSLAGLGRASYHVFLVQIVWFGLVDDKSFVAGTAGMLACSLVGLLYFGGLKGVSVARQAVPVRRETPATPGGQGIGEEPAAR